MRTEQELSDALDSMGRAEPDLPPLSPELEDAMSSLEPVRTRSPRRQLGLVLTTAFLYAAALILVLGVRRDFAHLPRPWLVLYGTAWILGFAVIAWMALVPTAGRMMPMWRRVGLGAIVAGLGFTIVGVAFARDVPGLSTMYEPTPGTVIERGHACLRLGLATALVPVALSILFLRGAVPIGSRWVAAGLGAAGGCLGGLFLHIHCPIAERFHLGVIHGGVVILGALLSAAIGPRFIRP